MRDRSREPAGGDGSAGFIAELHGVRGIALALVVLFHVFGQGRVSGGVDVFLFFSGFLLTGSMFRRSVAGQTGRVTRHYARTLLRLAPAAVTVLAAVVAAILLLRPLASQGDDLREVRASLLYYQNWELIWSQLSYGAAGPNASPLQHFWSMSLQGQFFLVWPWCVVALVSLGMRGGRDPWRIAVLGTSLITATSFLIAQVMVRSDQPVAYFHTASRWWELTLGGLLALVLMRWNLPSLLRPWAGWTGLVIVVAGGFVVNGGTVFPGPWVLLPLTGAALVLLGAGASGGPRGVLQTRPLTRLADIAYELYLWHWPILIFLLVIQDREVVGPRSGVFVVVVSTAAAGITHTVISRPLGRAKAARRARVLWSVGAVLTAAAVLSSALAVQVDRSVQRTLAASYVAEDYPGAEAVRNPSLSQESYPMPLGPPADVAGLDTEPAMGTECWQGPRVKAADPVQWCDGPSATNGPTVALVGSSRALTWQPALQIVAGAYGWSLTATARAGCPLRGFDGNRQCERWNDLVVRELLRDPPAAVVVEGTDISKSGGRAEYAYDPDGKAWKRLTDAGIEVLALRAPPRFLKNPPACAERLTGGTRTPCDRPADKLYSSISPFAALADASERLHELDLTPYYCPSNTCPVVLGNVITFRDGNHFTATFARTLAPILEEQMKEEVPELFLQR